VELERVKVEVLSDEWLEEHGLEIVGWDGDALFVRKRGEVRDGIVEKE
jgi:hypothetical protein